MYSVVLLIAEANCGVLLWSPPHGDDSANVASQGPRSREQVMETRECFLKIEGYLESATRSRRQMDA